MDSIQKLLQELGAQHTIGNVDLIKKWGKSIVDECGNIVVGKDLPMKHAETVTKLQSFKDKIY